MAGVSLRNAAARDERAAPSDVEQHGRTAAWPAAPWAAAQGPAAARPAATRRATAKNSVEIKISRSRRAESDLVNTD